MNEHLQKISDFFHQDQHLTPDEKSTLLKSLKDAASAFAISEFKLERTEKVKRTTAILLEETIEELEQKRKAVEAQNRELEIESSLERVRTVAMSMMKAEDMLDVCKTLSKQLELLNVMEIRNVQTAIFYPEKGTYMNYEYYAKHDSTFITETTYSNNEKHAEFAQKMLEGNGQFFELTMTGDEVKDWIDYQKTTNVYIDEFLYNAPSLNYYWQSLGPVALGISTYQPLKEDDFILFRRFLKVFELAYRRYLDIEKAEANALRAEQDLIEIRAARKKAEEALKELQITQKQLIQAEKMASLGELTAGIAHEIQNPLNFVNNFSDVSNELIEEIEEERIKNTESRDESLIGDILTDIKQNLEKISHHGRRADAIVKGMLQHSRTTSGQKEPTDINALADEYLRLAYHGLRAKDKSFNAALETDFDESIGKPEVVPQDIGRVILNLITNAFHAVDEKKNSGTANFEPTVSISTKKSGSNISISVKDNGNGIPDNIKEKIFQPFFTTKPTGEGTGLGLSLAYDIVKAHGGELKVESVEGAGTIFMILLPDK